MAFVVVDTPSFSVCRVLCSSSRIYLSSASSPEIILHQAIKPYPSATFLFEEFVGLNPIADEYTLFYWTPDSRDAVENYFKTVLSTTFAQSDERDNWIIASYQLNGVKPTPYSSQSIKTHPMVCNTWADRRSEEFKCISISLLRASQANLCLLPIVSPTDREYRQQEPYEKCNRIPKTGTLIIYKFHVDAW